MFSQFHCNDEILFFSDMEIMMNVKNSAMKNSYFTSISFRSGLSKTFKFDIANPNNSVCKVHIYVKVSFVQKEK